MRCKKGITLTVFGIQLSSQGQCSALLQTHLIVGWPGPQQAARGHFPDINTAGLAAAGTVDAIQGAGHSSDWLYCKAPLEHGILHSRPKD